MTIALASGSKRDRLKSKPVPKAGRLVIPTINALEYSLKIMRLADIKIGRHNLRGDIEVDLESKTLGLSIMDQGLISPLTARESGKDTILFAGFRRYDALKRAGIKCAPVLVVKNINEKKWRAIAIAENTHRKKLHSVEFARAVRDLQKSLGPRTTEKDVAKAIWISRSAVAKALSVSRLPEDIQEEALKQKTGVSQGALEELAQGTTEEEQRQLWADVKAGCSRNDVREKKKASKAKKHTTSKPTKIAPKRKTREIGKSLGGTLKVVRDLTGQLKSVSAEGLSHEDLDQIAELRKAGIALSKRLKFLLEKPAS
jgi:ParB/RepB/Spo0J family partition protein